MRTIKFRGYTIKEHCIVKINGFLYGTTANGRFRKNWRNDYRKKDRSDLLKCKQKGTCHKCKKYKKLTVHHDPPLYKSLNGKKRLLCEECHLEEEQKCEEKYRLKDRPDLLHCGNCKCHKNYYLDKELNLIFCKNCQKRIYLKKIGENNYKIIKTVH